MAANVEQILRRYQDLVSVRQQYESEWQTIAQYCHLARQLALTGGAAGSVLTGKVFDSISFTAPQILAASLHANLTNPATRWSRVKLRQADLNALDIVQDWCDDCSLRRDAARSASNFTSAIGELYLELPNFGNGALLIDGLPPVRSLRWTQTADGMRPTGEQTFSGFLYTNVPIGTYVIGRGRDGRVNTLIRRVERSLHAWAEEFGPARLPDAWRDKLATKPDDLQAMLHAVYPRTDDLWGTKATAMPYASVWVTEQEKHRVFESGYKSFPYAAPAWILGTGEQYGRGQAHLALPDIQVLNERVELRQWDWKMRLAPPLFQQPHAVRGALQWEAGKRNYANNKDSVWTVYTPSSVQEALEQENRLEAKIKATFFVDQIMALPANADGKIGGMSPYEVARRMEQVFRVLGPVYGNLEPQLLQVVSEREFRLMYDGGAFEPAPPEILARPDADIDFVFDSPMSRAQRADDAAAVESAALFTQQMAAATGNPKLWDNMDVDEGVRLVYEVRGLPAKVINGKDVVAQKREAAAQAEAVQMQQQEAMMATQGAKNLAPVIKAMQPAPGGQEAAA